MLFASVLLLSGAGHAVPTLQLYIPGSKYDPDAEDGSIKKFKFAPFSHDADSVVPEPGTLLLLGSGAYFRRKMG